VLSSGLLDTLAELSAAANDLPVRRSSVEAIDRPPTTRAELAFSVAVDDLVETETSGPTNESRLQPGGRRAGAEEPDDSSDIPSSPGHSHSRRTDDRTSRAPFNERRDRRPSGDRSTVGSTSSEVNGSTKHVKNPNTEYRDQFYSE